MIYSHLLCSNSFKQLTLESITPITELPDGQRKYLIACAARALSKQERKWTVHEREALAMNKMIF